MYIPLLLLSLVAAKPPLQYTLRVDSTNLSTWSVELRIANAPATFRVAMAAHPEYDDKYWRYLKDLSVDGGTVTREDSAVWRVVRTGTAVPTLRYRIELPPAPEGRRGSWRPFLSPTGGLLGGPHAFLYVVGAEGDAALVRLVLPASWQVATALDRSNDPRRFTAASIDALMESPILAGHLRQWQFTAGGVPHRVVYWPLPDAAPFDTAAFVGGVERIAREAIALFGRAPYREYTFLYQDGAYGGLEHPASVTLGASSTELAKGLSDVLAETAHEFFHTWNLMTIRPAEYRGVDYRTQPPVAGLWFSEGFTMFSADLLLRRAGLPVADSTRTAHLERLMSRYLFGPGNSHHSAEAVSRVAYNAEPGSLGDYNASTHLQGEVIAAMLDFVIRGATRGERSIDDVLRLMFTRFSGKPGFQGADVERSARTVRSPRRCA